MFGAMSLSRLFSWEILLFVCTRISQVMDICQLIFTSQWFYSLIHKGSVSQKLPYDFWHFQWKQQGQLMAKLAHLGLQLQKHHGFPSSPVTTPSLVPVPFPIQKSFLVSSWENTSCSTARDKQQVLKVCGNWGLPGQLGWMGFWRQASPTASSPVKGWDNHVMDIFIAWH